MRKKQMILIMALFLAFSLSLFAGNNDIALMTQSTVNNENFAYDMASKTAITLDTSQKDDTAFLFTPQAGYEAEILRIMNLLRNAVTITLNPMTKDKDGKMCFVHETNAMITRPFTISVYAIEAAKIKGDEQGSEVTWEYGDFSSSLENYSSKTDGGFTFTAHERGLGNEKPDDFYQYQFVINIQVLTEEEIEDLEAGDYYSFLEVTGIQAEGIGKGDIVLHEIIKIKGYRGEEFEPAPIPYFSIQPGEYTYSINLETEKTPVEVAKLNFNFMDILHYKIEEKGSDDKPKDDGLFKVLLSPSPDYHNVPAAVDPPDIETPYKFIKKDTEYDPRTLSNTVGYKISYIDEDGKDKDLDEYEDANRTKYANVYKIPVKRKPIQVAKFTHKAHPVAQFVYQWGFDPNPLSICVEPTPLKNQKLESGQYFSDLYFIVITDKELKDHYERTTE